MHHLEAFCLAAESAHARTFTSARPHPPNHSPKQLNAFDMRFKNPSNTRPLVWGGRLFSCYETGLPYELDPSSLATMGEFDFG